MNPGNLLSEDRKKADMKRGKNQIKKASERFKRECLNFSLESFTKFIISKSNDGMIALDLCCGHGYVALEIAKLFNLVIAVDINKHSVESISDRIENLNEKLNLIPFAADGHNLSFKDNSFDAVILRLALIDVKEPCKVLSEAHRVLKVGGLLFLSEVILPQEMVPIWSELAQLRYGYRKNFYWRSQLLSAIRDAGFKINCMSTNYENRDLEDQCKMLRKPTERWLFWQNIDELKKTMSGDKLFFQAENKPFVKYKILNLCGSKIPRKKEMYVKKK